MDFFSFLKPKVKTATEQPVEEARSTTYGGVTVANWDSAFSNGKNIDKISVVYGCVSLRSNTIASLPITLNKKLDKGHEPAVDHPYYNLVTKSPNPFMTNFTFWSWAVTQLDLFGNVYIQRIRRNDGLTAELVPLNPYSVEINIDANGAPNYKMLLTLNDGTSVTKEFTNDQIIHIKGYTRNGIYGMSVIETFRTLFDGYSELESAGTAIAKNAARPSGIIYHPGNIKEEELNKLKSGWAAGFSGNNSGRTAFLPNTLKSEAINSGLTAQEAEYISQKEFSAQRIVADIFGCPLHRFGLTGAPTYASVELNSLEFVNWTLAPIITNIEQTLNKALLDDSDEYYINFNVSGLLRGDIKTRIEWYRFAMGNGVMTSNQVNQAEDTGVYVDPKDGGDDYLRPANYVAVGKPTAQPAQNSGSNSPVAL